MNQKTSGVTFAPTRHLPSPLIAARATAMHHLNCLDLDLTARRTLYGILTFITIKNLKREIFPRRETLRQEAMLGSDGTLYRGLAKLEAKGYITREQKRQTRTGKFYLSPIVLTEKAIVLLGLKELIHKYRSTKMEDGQYKEHTKEPQSLQKSSSKADPVDNIDHESKLPKELTPLLQLRVSKSAICMLMTQAKANGKRLSIVMKAVWHNIIRLKGREVVAYLAYLLKQDRDFTSRAHEFDQEITQQRYRNTFNTLDHRYDGCRVLNRSGQDIGVFVCRDGGSPRIEQYENGVLSVIPVNLNFAIKFLEGQMRFTKVSSHPWH